MRDDFPIDVKRSLALRVRHTCSNPDCLAPTAGPQDDPSGTVNIGVAAHITAAASGGKRFDPNLTPEQRGSIDNGIWLCQNCAKLIVRGEMSAEGIAATVAQKEFPSESVVWARR